MNSVPEQPDSALLHQRRQRVGWAALLSLVIGSVSLWQASGESAWGSACIRVGVVLGAVWLCLPTRTRPAAWASLTPARLIIIAVAAILIQRLKFALPVMAAAGFLGWLIKPRNRSPGRRVR